MGGQKLNEQIFFEQIHLGIDAEIVVITLDKPIEVTGPKRVTIPIPKAETPEKVEKVANLVQE